MRRSPDRGWKSWPCGCGRRRPGLAASLQRLEPAGGESDQKKREKYLAAANQGLYRLLRLADHLEFADARDQDLYRPAPLDMAGFCRELFREVESVCAMSGYRFSYETELVTLLTVGDEALLRRLVSAWSPTP